MPVDASDVALGRLLSEQTRHRTRATPRLKNGGMRRKGELAQMVCYLRNTGLFL
jgi:hypothetical protein